MSAFSGRPSTKGSPKCNDRCAAKTINTVTNRGYRTSESYALRSERGSAEPRLCRSVPLPPQPGRERHRAGLRPTDGRLLCPGRSARQKSSFKYSAKRKCRVKAARGPTGSCTGRHLGVRVKVSTASAIPSGRARPARSTRTQADTRTGAGRQRHSLLSALTGNPFLHVHLSRKTSAPDGSVPASASAPSEEKGAIPAARGARPPADGAEGARSPALAEERPPSGSL